MTAGVCGQNGNGVVSGRRVLVAYGSETGNAEKVATHLCHLLSAAGLTSTLEAADDVEVRVSLICAHPAVDRRARPFHLSACLRVRRAGGGSA